MARRRPGLVAIRRIFAGALLFAGLFVSCFGLGYGQRTVVISGATIMALALGARMATTFRRNPRQWVRGTGHVVEVSDPPTDARSGQCAMTMVVDVPGLDSERVHVQEQRVAVAQWPRPGDELPIQVAADDISNVRVRWRYHVPAEPAFESAFEAAWEDDQPAPVPAAPPPSQLHPPDEPEIDFDIDGPPTEPIRPVASAAPATGGQGNGEHRVPRPRPSPRPRREPVAAPTAEATTATMAPVEAEPVDADVVSDLVTTYPSAHPGPAGAIYGVGVTLIVSELPRSVAFYRDRLGFYEVDGGDDNVVLASGETRLVLRQAAGLGSIKRRVVHVNLEVADVDAMYAELKRNGIRFIYPPQPVNRTARLELWAAAFRDPDGHGIALTQWRPRLARSAAGQAY